MNILETLKNTMKTFVVTFRFFLILILLTHSFSDVEGELQGEEGSGSGGLSYGFYQESCPQVETIVRESIEAFSLSDPSLPSALLRLMFHDCQVQGCDASILLDPQTTTTPTEITAKKNFGVRKRETISMIKSTLEATCPKQVSCSDILILAARDAVSVSGGPQIQVPLGRRDSATTPENTTADESLPPSTIGVDGMLDLFAKKGMTIEESVAIMGAHTLGVTHCVTVLNRLNGSGKGQPLNAGPWFEVLLKMSCPQFLLATKNTTFVPNDPTALIFDNAYYVSAMEGNGVLLIDAEMPADPRTAPFVERFAADEAEFFRAFSSAFVKLSMSGVLTGNQGVIRNSCNMLS